MNERRASTSDLSSVTFGDSSLRKHSLSPASMRVTGVQGLDMSSSSASAIEGLVGSLNRLGAPFSVRPALVRGNSPTRESRHSVPV